MRRPVVAAALALAVVLSGPLLAGIPLPAHAPLDQGVARAARKTSPIDCPRKIGGFKNQPSEVGISETGLQCFYTRRPGNVKNGAVRIAVRWQDDTPEERRRCSSRDPQSVDDAAGGPEDFNRRIESAQWAANGTYYVTKGKQVKREQAEAALLKLLAAAETQAHPCVPEPEPTTGDGFVCPLVVGDAFVRADWYGDDPPEVELGLAEPSVNLFSFECTYAHAYADEGEGIFSRLLVSWAEGDRDDPTFGFNCREQHRDDGFATTDSSGRYPIQTRINNDLVAAGGQAIADRLVATAAARTQLCPGATAPDGSDVAVTGAGGDPDSTLTDATGDTADGPLDAAAGSYLTVADRFDAEKLEADAIEGRALEATDPVAVAEGITTAYVAHAAAAEALAGDLESLAFPPGVQEAVDDLIAASAEEARLWRTVAGDPSDAAPSDPEAIFAAQDELFAATDVREKAAAGLRQALGLGLEPPGEDG